MDVDTAMGGQAAPFPSTLWTNVLQAGDVDDGKRRAAWEDLARRYWKPVYLYIRVKWAKSNEDAKDLAQDFFAWMMKTGLPQRADPGRGRFRVFVKAALENYLRMDLRNRLCQKRGGDRVFIHFTPTADQEGIFEVADHAGKTPEQILEDAWKTELLERATARLRESYERRGKTRYFAVFKDFYLGSNPRASHDEMAATHGLSSADVNNYLMDAKRTLREILKDLLAETVERPEDIHEEFKELFGQGPP